MSVKLGNMSEDMTTFTTFTEDDQNGGNVTKDDDIGNELDNINDDELRDIVRGVDFSKISDDAKPEFEKLIGAINRAGSKIGDLKSQTDTTRILRELVNVQAKPTVNADLADANIKKATKLAETLKSKFQADDYYAPFFVELASALDGMVEGFNALKTDMVEDKKRTFKDTVVGFVTGNKIPKEVVSKMDEIANAYGSQMYSDLPRLLKYAKLELGLDPNKSFVSKERTDEPVRRKGNVVDMGGVRRRGDSSSNKKISSMADAFNAAEEQLAE